MSTSQTVARFDPNSTEKISSGTLAYIRARNKNALYNLIIREFKKSGLTQTDLAKRMGRTADVVCRLLGRPTNMEIDTASDFLFAICGAAFRFETHRPQAAMAEPKWIDVNPLSRRVDTTGYTKDYGFEQRRAA